MRRNSSIVERVLRMERQSVERLLMKPKVQEHQWINAQHDHHAVKQKVLSVLS